jgi:hypothetical protein
MSEESRIALLINKQIHEQKKAYELYVGFLLPIPMYEEHSPQWEHTLLLYLLDLRKGLIREANLISFRQSS